MKNDLFEIDVVEDEEFPAEIIVQSSEEVMKGDIFSSENETIRVIDVREAGIMVIDLDMNAIRLIECSVFFAQIELGLYKKQAREVVKYVELPAEEMKKMKKTREMLESILDSFYPNWNLIFRNGMKKPSCCFAAKELNITTRHLRNLMRTYLRSGRDLYSLADQRKFNKRPAVKLVIDTDPRKDTDLLYHEAMAKFKETLSVQAAYDYILRKYFRESVTKDGVMRMELIPEEEITLSYFQVYDYIRKHLGGLTIKEYIKGEKELRNNGGFKPGNVRHGVSKLGQCYEADECEIPCYIVDEDTGEVVGKAIVYIVVEVMSGIICGCYVSYENNSYNGLRQVLLSMLEPHYYQTRKYDLNYTEEEFPSMLMPDELRCDHGAEYESHSVVRAVGELGIRITYVPVACGSAKGLVESINNQIQIFLKTYAKDAGVVKDEYRGGDIAKGNACLTLEELRAIVYDCIIYINTRTRPEFDADAGQMKAGMATSPAAVYAFEKKRSGDPRNVNKSNRDIFLYNLIARDGDKRKFHIDREKGIHYSGHILYYFADEQWFKDMLRDEKHLENIEVRYEEGNVGCVYVCYKNIIHKVPLSEMRNNQRTFLAMSWNEYDELEKLWKASPSYKEAERKAKNRKFEVIDRLEQKVDQAKAMQGEGSKYGKAQKEDRAAAREKLKKDFEEIANRMYNEVGQVQEEPAETDSIETEAQEVIQTVTSTVPAIEQKETVPALEEVKEEANKRRRPRRKSIAEESAELAKLLVRED
ncbi:MAG: hypothetical protein ACI4EG_01515 [Fusicatenibacter sp.]